MLIGLRKETFGSVPQNYKNTPLKFHENRRFKSQLVYSVVNGKKTLKLNLNKT
jgi:hypothetical protein